MDHGDNDRPPSPVIHDCMNQDLVVSSEDDLSVDIDLDRNETVDEEVGSYQEYGDFSAAKIPSLHSVKQKANVAAWNNARSSLLRVCIELNCLPRDQVCTLCKTHPASIRCRQCGPYTYYCSICLEQCHSVATILHSPEEYKVSVIKCNKHCI